MFDLNIDFDALKEVGNSINVKAEEFGQLLNNIKAANSELTQAWQGTNASKYTDKVTEQAVVMEKLQQAIAEVGQQLLTINNLYATAMNDTTLQ